jgi:hypothetical protein
VVSIVSVSSCRIVEEKDRSRGGARLSGIALAGHGFVTDT